MQMDDKYVAVKVPKDLHVHLKAKAKETGMTLGNYLFDCICKYHNIKFVPASVEIPVEEPVVEETVVEESVVEEPVVEEIAVESPVSEEIQKDMENMEEEKPAVEIPALDEQTVETKTDVGG